MVMSKFCDAFSDQQLNEVTVDHILDFLNQLADGCKPQTKRVRYAHLAAFFNFVKNNLISDFVSPCDSKMLRKLYRPNVKIQWDILEKETVDEIIFRTTNAIYRLMLELMAGGGMRVGEVLKLKAGDACATSLNMRAKSRQIG
jgi:site-specific recombinase XerD